MKTKSLEALGQTTVAKAIIAAEGGNPKDATLLKATKARIAKPIKEKESETFPIDNPE